MTTDRASGAATGGNRSPWMEIDTRFPPVLVPLLVERGQDDHATAGELAHQAGDALARERRGGAAGRKAKRSVGPPR